MQANLIQSSIGTVSNLFSSVAVRIDHRHRTPDNQMYLAIPSSATSLGCERAGTSLHQFARGRNISTPITYVEVTPEMREVIAAQGLSDGELTDESQPLEQVYSLELLANRRLLLVCSQILGSKILGTLTEAQYDAVIDGLAAGVKAFVGKFKLA